MISIIIYCHYKTKKKNFELSFILVVNYKDYLNDYYYCFYKTKDRNLLFKSSFWWWII